MDTVVLKFGGSSVADDIRLNIVADKILNLYKENNVVVIVSAQGKTTDKLFKEAQTLTLVPNNRELDVLLSTGEQITMSKLCILLQSRGYNAISLTGWQAGIYTNNTNQDAIIESINPERIIAELSKRKIVVIAGFQGINENGDITTLGRGGSDTTAVAIASAINAKKCYIFSDVDGVYTTDPNKISSAKKLENVSYEEMQDIADEGAKVLHNRCVEIAEKFDIPIITRSTFNDKPGTIVSNKIEDSCIKSIVKNDDIIIVSMKYDKYSLEMFNDIYNRFIENDIFVLDIKNDSEYKLDITFVIKVTDLSKLEKLLTEKFKDIEYTYKNISKISIIGQGIKNDANILKKIMNVISINKLDVLNITLTETKILVMFKNKIQNNVLEQLHKDLIEYVMI